MTFKLFGMDNFYVYQYLREVDSANGAAGTPYYIGKGRGKRKTSTSRTTPKPTNPKCITLVAENLSEAKAFELEKKLISEYGRIDTGTGCLRNFTDGGEGNTGFKPSPELRALWSAQRKGNQRLLGFKFSEESKKKMSDARKGKKRSAQFCENLSKALTGIKKSPETCKNISLAKVGKPTKPNKGRTGQHWTEDDKKKQAEFKTTWWSDKQNKMKQSEGMKKWWAERDSNRLYTFRICKLQKINDRTMTRKARKSRR